MIQQLEQKDREIKQNLWWLINHFTAFKWRATESKSKQSRALYCIIAFRILSLLEGTSLSTNFFRSFHLHFEGIFSRVFLSLGKLMIALTASVRSVFSDWRMVIDWYHWYRVWYLKHLVNDGNDIFQRTAMFAMVFDVILCSVVYSINVMMAKHLHSTIFAQQLYGKCLHIDIKVINN